MHVSKSLDEQTIASNAEWVRQWYGPKEAVRYVELEYKERAKEGRVDDPQFGKELINQMIKDARICSLGDCIKRTPVTSYGADGVPAYGYNKEKKEKKMSYASATLVQTTAEQPTDQKQRKYLAQRADDIYYVKKTEARKTFGLEDTPQPKTVKEFIEFIKNDKFTVEEKYLDRRATPYCATDYIRFRDPSIKEDQAGYDAFKDAISKALKTLKDDIVILDPKEGLEKLREFEAATFQ